MKTFASAATLSADFEQSNRTLRPEIPSSCSILKIVAVTVGVNNRQLRFCLLKHSPQNDISVPLRTPREEHLSNIWLRNDKFIVPKLPSCPGECIGYP